MGLNSAFIIASLFTLLFTLFAFMVAISITVSNRFRSRQAARLVGIALGLKVFSLVGGWIGMAIFAQIGNAQSVGLAAAISQPIQSLLGAVVLLLFVRAAFVDREETSVPTDASLSGGVPGWGQ